MKSNIVLLIIVLIILGVAVWYFVNRMGRLSTGGAAPAGPVPMEQMGPMPPGEMERGAPPPAAPE